MVCQLALSLSINFVDEEIVLHLKTYFLLRCLQLLGICTLKVCAVEQEERKTSWRQILYICQNICHF